MGGGACVGTAGEWGAPPAYLRASLPGLWSAVGAGLVGQVPKGPGTGGFGKERMSKVQQRLLSAQKPMDGRPRRTCDRRL